MRSYGDEQFTETFAGVPEPVRQIGVYELDLVKFGYFGCINCLSLGLGFWRALLEVNRPEWQRQFRVNI